jgi:intracellular sulfur oxidation DsrE/DsrF family protein
MRTIAICLAMALTAALAAPCGAAETQLASPRPDLDNPRKIVLQLSSKDPREINNLLFNVVNVQKFYGMDNVRIAVIAFGDGMQALYAKTSPVTERIESLQQYGVEFVACGSTMTATNKAANELIKGVEIVTAGIPEIVERSLRGWIYIRP